MPGDCATGRNRLLVETELLGRSRCLARIPNSAFQRRALGIGHGDALETGGKGWRRGQQTHRRCRSRDLHDILSAKLTPLTLHSNVSYVNINYGKKSRPTTTATCEQRS